MGEVTRFGVSLDEKLLREFDRLIVRKGYPNRSEAIRDLIREALVREQWEVGTETAVGTITLVYDHETRDLADKLTDLQHAHYETIVSTLHVHLDAHHCLEVLVLRGRGKDVVGMGEGLVSTKGVKYGKLVPATTGQDLR